MRKSISRKINIFSHFLFGVVVYLNFDVYNNSKNPVPRHGTSSLKACEMPCRGMTAYSYNV